MRSRTAWGSVGSRTSLVKHPCEPATRRRIRTLECVAVCFGADRCPDPVSRRRFDPRQKAHPRYARASNDCRNHVAVGSPRQDLEREPESNDDWHWSHHPNLRLRCSPNTTAIPPHGRRRHDTNQATKAGSHQQPRKPEWGRCDRPGCHHRLYPRYHDPNTKPCHRPCAHIDGRYRLQAPRHCLGFVLGRGCSCSCGCRRQAGQNRWRPNTKPSRWLYGRSGRKIHRRVAPPR